MVRPQPDDAAAAMDTGDPPPDDARTDGPYRCTLKLPGHARAISAVRFSPDGTLLASASADATVRLHDTRTGSLYAVLRGHMQGVSDVAWSSDSAMVATASDDMTVMLWDVATATLLRILRGHSNYVFCVAFNGASNLLLSGSFDETIRVWDARTGACIKTLPAHSDPVSSVSFSKDGTLIVSSSYDGLVRLWDADSGQCLKTLVGADNPPVGSVVFSPNGTYVLVATLDSKVRLWEYGTAKVVKTYGGGCDERYCMPAVFVPVPPSLVGQVTTPHVVSGSEAGAPVIWDGHTKSVLQRLAGHESPVVAVTAHPVRAVIATGGMADDPTVRVWVHEADVGDDPSVADIPRVPQPDTFEPGEDGLGGEGGIGIGIGGGGVGAANGGAGVFGGPADGSGGDGDGTTDGSGSSGDESDGLSDDSLSTGDTGFTGSSGTDSSGGTGSSESDRGRGGGGAPAGRSTLSAAVTARVDAPRGRRARPRRCAPVRAASRGPAGAQGGRRACRPSSMVAVLCRVPCDGMRGAHCPWWRCCAATPRWRAGRRLGPVRGAKPVRSASGRAGGQAGGTTPRLLDGGIECSLLLFA